nr:MAG TPA: ferric uptake regulation protein [Caudoviricetes sp.]
MRTMEKQRKGYRRNQLLRYKAIMDEFNLHDCRYVPISVIWREFIYPKFFISRKTLYRVLSMDIEKELSNC